MELTVEQVRERISRISAIAKQDAERAHSFEDELYVDTLTAIAHGAAVSPAELSKAALAARDLEFDRWYS